jgi:hypothetical protein
MAGAGIGEAMLLGAAMGGGSAAITGGDPLKGALLGGLTGGAGAGIGGALTGAAGTTALVPELAGSALGSSLAPTATSLSTLAPSAAPNLAAFTGSGVSSAGAGLGGNLGASLGGAGIPSVLPSASTLGAGLAPTASNFSALGAGAAPNLASISGGVTGGLPNAATAAAPQTFTQGMAKFANDPIASIMRNKPTAFASGLAGALGGREEMGMGEEEYDGPLSRYRFNPESYRAALFAGGGIADLAAGGYDRIVGDAPSYSTNMAKGGISDLGGYSDGGRMLKGPGDGMSDSIPASISGKRPARLADGEFVVPADVVSHLGNGSTDAGAKQLYAMMDKVRKARTGRKAQGREINPRQYMAA